MLFPLSLGFNGRMRRQLLHTEFISKTLEAKKHHTKMQLSFTFVWHSTKRCTSINEVATPIMWITPNMLWWKNRKQEKCWMLVRGTWVIVKLTCNIYETLKHIEPSTPGLNAKPIIMNQTLSDVTATQSLMKMMLVSMTTDSSNGILLKLS